MNDKSGIEKACDKMGGQKFLADALGVTPQAVSQWVKQGYAPITDVDRVTPISDLTGVARKELCDPRLVALVQG